MHTPRAATLEQPFAPTRSRRIVLRANQPSAYTSGRRAAQILQHRLNGVTMGKFGSRIAASLAALATLIFAAASAAQPAAIVPPLAIPGPYPVACSNVAQDFSRMAPGEDVQAYWEGVPRADNSPRYITDLLSDPANTLSFALAVPSDASIYGSFAGSRIPVVVLVCYPTSANNGRADFPLPNGNTVPHMQRSGEAPMLADPAAAYPLVVFSHGYLGSPLSNDYLQAITILASYGYVVAAPFHGDARIAQFQLESVSDFAYLATHLADFLALQSLRPLELSAMLDLMLSHPQWKDRIDASSIGGFGASLGGESMLLMAGAGMTSSVGQSWTKIDIDPRLKAAVGYVPYFGQPVFPAFGRDQHGLDDMTLPFLAIAGTADTTAPLVSTTQGIQHLQGTRELVTLAGVTHGFDVASTNDIFTWTITFLDAQVRHDAAASARLTQMGSVSGGGDDHAAIAVLQPPQTPNYSGLWWRSPAGSESGWGINVAHQGDVIFLTWFTYSDNGSALWVSMTAFKVSDGNYSGTIYRTTGPPLSVPVFDPGTVTRVAVGTGNLTFFDPNNGFFNYTMNGVTQTKPITRQVFGPLPTCTWPAAQDLSLDTNYTDIWWNPAESGWGVNLAHEGDTIFGTWFTYDQSGMPLWLSFTALPTTTPGIYSGTLYRTVGPAFDAVPFDPDNVTRMVVGSAGLAFSDGNHAAFTYDLFGVDQTRAITRQVFRPPGTACH